MDEPAIKHLDAWLAGVLLVAMILALYMAFLVAPQENTMLDLQRIFYFHVPSGIMGLAAFVVNFFASLMYLRRKDRKWDSLALSAAEVGVMFFTIVLVTGPIWAKPAWYVWWTWSPRLTFSLLLWMLYVAYMLVRNYVPDPDRKAAMSAVFGIVAFLDAPIVFFSIRWWRDLHPLINEKGKGGLEGPMMVATFCMCIAAFLLLMVCLIRRRYFLEKARLEAEQLARAADLAR
jgi:heme exporter protein C